MGCASFSGDTSSWIWPPDGSLNTPPQPSACKPGLQQVWVRLGTNVVWADVG